MPPWLHLQYKYHQSIFYRKSHYKFLYLFEYNKKGRPYTLHIFYNQGNKNTELFL